MDTMLTVKSDLFPNDLSNLAGSAAGMDGSDGTIHNASIDSSNLESEAITKYIEELSAMKALMESYYDLFTQDCNLVYQMVESLLGCDTDASSHMGSN